MPVSASESTSLPEYVFTVPICDLERCGRRAVYYTNKKRVEGVGRFTCRQHLARFVDGFDDYLVTVSKIEG